jgi:hypothetical protein
MNLNAGDRVSHSGDACSWILQTRHSLRPRRSVMWPEQEQEGILSGVEQSYRLPDPAIRKNPKTCPARVTQGERPGEAASWTRRVPAWPATRALFASDEGVWPR